MFDLYLERSPLFSPGIALEIELYQKKSDEVTARVMALVIPLLHLVGAFISLMAIPITLLMTIRYGGGFLIFTLQSPNCVVRNLACCVASILEIPQRIWNGPHNTPSCLNTRYGYASIDWNS